MLEFFSRTPYSMEHRQIAICLRAEEHVEIADKTALKIMRELGIFCGISRKSGYRRYNSYKDVVGRTFENLMEAQLRGGASLREAGNRRHRVQAAVGQGLSRLPIYDFATKEIADWSISRHSDIAQQMELQDQPMEKLPGDARPIMQSDMGWQYQNRAWRGRLKEAHITQSRFRKGNYLDNAATE